MCNDCNPTQDKAIKVVKAKPQAQEQKEMIFTVFYPRK